VALGSSIVCALLRTRSSDLSDLLARPISHSKCEREEARAAILVGARRRAAQRRRRRRRQRQQRLQLRPLLLFAERSALETFTRDVCAGILELQRKPQKY